MSNMNQPDYGPSRRWVLLPVLAAAGIAAASIAVWLYAYHASALPATTPPWSGWWFPFGWFLFIPVFFLIFFAFRWFVWGGWWWGRGSYYGWNDPAHEILRKRFARGELTKEQYQQMMRDLDSAATRRWSCLGATSETRGLRQSWLR